METTTNATYTTDTRHNREKGSVNKTSKAVPKWFKHSGEQCSRDVKISFYSFTGGKKL